jgi:hypothetical protein
MCRAGRVEQTIGKLKRFKRIAKRCGKTSGSYGATLNLWSNPSTAPGSNEAEA